MPALSVETLLSKDGIMIAVVFFVLVVTLLLICRYTFLFVRYKWREPHLKRYSFGEWLSYNTELSKLKKASRKAEREGGKIAARLRAERDFQASQTGDETTDKDLDPLPNEVKRSSSEAP